MHEALRLRDDDDDDDEDDGDDGKTMYKLAKGSPRVADVLNRRQ